MARAIKNVVLSKIKNAVTGEFYPQSFVSVMEKMGKPQEKWAEIYGLTAEVASSQKEEANARAATRTKNAKDRQDKVDAIVKKLDITLPKDVTLKSVEVKPKGPSVEEEIDGVKTGEKVQEVTHYDVEVRWGKRGEGRLLRGSVSVGGEKNRKSEEVINTEIDAVTEELMLSLVKIVA